MLSCQSSKGASIWADAIIAKEYRKIEMMLVQWKAVLRCILAYCTVSTETVRVQLAMDEYKGVYSTTYRISPESGKASLQISCDKKLVTLHKWEERLSKSSKGEWACLLINNYKT